ncbi:MAG: hypothetical protein A2261_01370 [Candidatus Magasanikbacteria bacterium RIFOXYA2_FULL_44_8]|uniref:N-end rule aminoacyl transferase C-terminal domain-containing protein n=1 Tax=Candidatus Magasanikbacteria bacterium RIFOXYA2_FULL_44_8 TaxID=1798696 RepID=A0A1F6NM78_9BACT|nr:MAG: hypothetical protein A2261_01370 [Candidatus Magasanikbacteria bacterium RIFOXYA2_FULL_44_8]
MYLKLSEKIITNLTDKNINDAYDGGFLFTRESKGAMYETRSVRIDLRKFDLSSENRRVLRKTENIKMEVWPVPYSGYTWEIAKLGKDFYETKFGKGTFSANKIKELLTDPEKSNFNKVIVYSIGDTPVGYAICSVNDEILHYSYPFYDLKANASNLGISMMTQAIIWAKENNKKYVYLGSASTPVALYKTQFRGLEWWNEKSWNTDVEELKNILK